jgi:cytochrome c553
MNLATRENRLPIMLSDQEIREISEYRWRNRVKSQTEAARQLIAKGLKASEQEKAA